jgi:hypothetical protein
MKPEIFVTSKLDKRKYFYCVGKSEIINMSAVSASSV